MKIKHKLTGDEVKISRLKWDDEYIPKRLDEVYEILEDDCVLLREILDNGDRKPSRKFDREHAIRMIKSNPTKYDFIEVKENEKESSNNYNPADKFSKEERDSIDVKLDELAHKLERIETGQRLIYDDIVEQIEELRKLALILGKNTWTQTLKGKLVDWGLGELTEKGFDLLTETFKDDKLLNG